VLWTIIFYVAVSGSITVRDIDMFNRMAPEVSEPRGTDG